MPKTVRINIRTDEETRKKLHKVARMKKTTLSTFVLQTAEEKAARIIKRAPKAKAA
jgi:uncharacterized protein (DUF1778 family)